MQEWYFVTAALQYHVKKNKKGPKENTIKYEKKPKKTLMDPKIIYGLLY